MDCVEAALAANRAYVAGMAALIGQMEAQEVAIMKRMKFIRETMRAEQRAAMEDHFAEAIGQSSKPASATKAGTSKKRSRAYFQNASGGAFHEVLVWQNPDALFVRAVRSKFQNFNFPPHRKWLPKELSACREAVDAALWRDGVQWHRIPVVAKLNGRTGHACYLQWTMERVRAVEATHPWTSDEDNELRRLRESAMTWGDVASTMSQLYPERPVVSYMLRFLRHIQGVQHKTKWTDADDAALKAAVAVHGGEANVWQLVAECLDGFLPNQCGTRWRQSTCPLVKTGNFTLEEDRRLLLAMGADKKRQVEMFPERNMSWYKHVDWNMVKELVPQRTSAQCRERFNDSLHPNLVTSAFTREEDELLRHWVSIHGTRTWRLISQHLPGRTNDQCRRRWGTLHSKLKVAATHAFTQPATATSPDSQE
ncbi:hypothetical protein H310_05890 [Aphanomyces invadans]|uniref:Uncharacterized protein n=1 Tax=Aphanomyces invadans TaxID=157072 RepID=A0A024U7G7_9STRA|nr:hypothetical protein H310_05890 [Aphanomyces invadans]ETW02356.1 hypothetical protein H310_05890 [Aphanomyces invadans]|eukprot:XP_008868961.1 hypothetical protein H310_05890 [Aphanomyces invadans]